MPGDGDPGEPADIAVLAVPPAAVAATLLDAQKRDLARVYTDVASVKARPLREAAELGCDLTCFVAGHPLAGRERSGPAAARGDLFLGRPWALCPTAETPQAAVGGRAARWPRRAAPRPWSSTPTSTTGPSRSSRTARTCRRRDRRPARGRARGGAGPGRAGRTRRHPHRGRRPRAVDRHPQLERRARWPTSSRRSPPTWPATAAALRAGGGDARHRPAGARRRPGRRRLPGKHGDRAGTYAVVSVVIPDRPGELALLFQAAGVAGRQHRGRDDRALARAVPVGVVELSVTPAAAQRLAEELRARGWSVPG